MRNELRRHDLTFLEECPTRPVVIANHGGACRGASKKPEACRHNVLASADAERPLAQDELPPSSISLPQGAGQSIVSVNGVHGDLDHIVENGGNHLLGIGAEGSIAVGKASAKSTAASPHAKELAQDIYTKFLATAGANTNGADVFSTYGSGGQSTGGGSVVEEVILEPFRRTLSDIQVERFSTGYALNRLVGRARKLPLNVVAWFVCALYWVRSTSKSRANEVRLVTMCNLASATNEAEKEFLTGSLFQSYLAESVRKHRAEHRNIIADNSAGRVSLLRYGTFDRLDAREIAAEARRHYLRPLEDLQRTVAQPLVVEDALKPISRSVANGDALSFPSLVAVAKKIAGSRDKRPAKIHSLEKLVDAAAVASQSFVVGAFVKYQNLEIIELARVLEYLDRLGNTFKAFKLRRRIVATLQRDVAAMLAELKTAQQRQKRSLVRRTAKLGWSLIWFAAVTSFLLARLLVLTTPPALRSRLLKKAFLNVARAALAFAELTAAILFFSTIAAILESEKERLDRQLDNAVAVLKKAPHVDEAEPPAVVMLDLERAWPAVRQMEPAQWDLNQDTLSRLVDSVTARGLKKILNAQDADAETLVKAAFTTEPAWGPHFSTENNMRLDDRLVVFPRVDGNLQETLMRHAGQFANFGRLMFADAATHLRSVKT